MSEEHYFCSSSSYDPSLLSHPYCSEALTSREACMYGGMDTDAVTGGPVGTEDLPPPSLNCNMWASVPSYPRYGMQTVEAVPYQPFGASIAPHHSTSMQRPQPPPPTVPELLSFTTQRALPPAASSSSTPSPSGAASCDRASHPNLYHRKAESPLRIHRDFSSYTAQSSTSSREPIYQYQMGFSSVGAHWTENWNDIHNIKMSLEIIFLYSLSVK